MVDGYIAFHEEDKIAVEVMLAADQELREFNAALTGDPQGLDLPLASGSGQWIASVDGIDSGEKSAH